MQHKLLILIPGLALMLSGCSLMKRNNAESFHSGDAIPLYAVNSHGKSATGLAGRWYISTVGTIRLQQFEDNEWPYLEFIPSEARFYGYDGCNIINGGYHIPSGKSLELSEIATTMKLCQSDTLAYPIARALNEARSFSTSHSADGSRMLTLSNSAGKILMTLRSSDIEFLNGPWQVVAINGKEVNVDAARLIFDVAANTVRGNAGCNRLNGELTRNPRVSASVQFSNLATTRMTCPDIETESALLIALEEVTQARLEKNAAVLLDASGKPLVKLTRLSKSDF